MRVTFVKKILANGAPCAKCGDVERRLERSGLLARIDRVVVADERDEDSEGMRLARRHQVQLAPFFLVDNGGATTVYTVYLKFVREIFGGEPMSPSTVGRADVESAEVEEARDLLRANPDLDLV